MSMKMGSWWVRSIKDKRWDGTGKDIVGGFGIPPKAQAHVDKIEKELGEKPDDLEFGYMKD